MTDDPYGSLDEHDEAGSRAPFAQPSPETGRPPAAPAPAQSRPAEPQPGYSYQAPDVTYPYGPPPHEQAGYGVPYVQQPYPPLMPVAPQFLEDPTAADAPTRHLSLVEAYTRFWKRGVTFSGRASQTEFWLVALVHGIAMAGYVAVFNMFPDSGLSSFVSMLAGLYGLAALIPSLALGTRRLHDTDSSGALLLIGIIPYLGPLILLILMALSPKPGGVRYDKINRR